MTDRTPRKNLNMNKYIEEGALSFRRNKSFYKNPYSNDSKEHNDFERGWSQELKKADSSELSRSNYNKPFKKKPSKNSWKKIDKLDSSKEKYLKSKGV